MLNQIFKNIGKKIADHICRPARATKLIPDVSDTPPAQAPKPKMSSSVVFPSNFNASRMSVSPLKTLDSGAKQAYINYDGGKFVFQTPSEMTLPYGVSVSDKSKFGGTGIDYALDLSLKDHDQEDSPMYEYAQMLHKFDEFMIDEAYKNRKAWFRADHSKETIRAFYTPAVKISKDKDGNPKPYPPTHKVKLQKDREGKFIAKFFNSRGKPIKDQPVEEILPKKSTVTVLVECGTLWFAAGSKFGVTWKASQVLIQKTPERMSDFGFQGIALETGGADDEYEGGGSSSASNLIDDEEALGAAAAPAPTKSAVAAMMPKAKPAAAAPAPAPAKPEANPFESVDVPDGSDHEAEDAEPIPAPAPVKKPVATATKVVKKVVKKP